MATITYRIKGTKSLKTVYARMYYSKKINVETSTGLKVYSKDWSNAKECVKRTANSASYIDETNFALAKLKHYFQSEVALALQKSTPITKGWLKEIVSECFNQSKDGTEEDPKLFFIPFVLEFIERAKTEIRPKTGVPRSTRTIQEYQGTMRKLVDYEKNFEKAKLTHSDINLNFHKKFLKYCSEHLQIKPKTIGKQIANVKLFCREAEKVGIASNFAHKTQDFYSPDNETQDFALSEQEIKKLETANIKNERLQNARDWLIIGIWTGLRVSDLLELNATSIDKDGFISIQTKKTKNNVIIPIHSSVSKILKCRKGKFPRKISSQKFNDYIKEVAKIAGLTNEIKGGKVQKVNINGKSVNRKIDGIYPKYELLTSHCCRRTFATFHYGKLDTLTIMKITGHKTESQFLEYVKITPTQHAEAMKKMWNEYFKNHK